MTKYIPPSDYNYEGGIFIVIYVDVLFIINFFITFLLLEITAKLTKKNASTPRFVAASVLGGISSLIILLDISDFFAYILKIAAAVLIILAAFNFYRVKSIALSLLVFLFSNFVFLGVIFGLYLITKSEKIALKNGSVYIDISARQLLFCSLIAYLTACLIVRIYNKKLSKGEIYTLKIFSGEKCVSVFALTDTGNKLREPFSDKSVIVADKNKMKNLYDENKLRIIPASSVNGDGFLYAFKADKVCISTDKGSEVIEGVYIALSDKMKNGEISAVVNPEILCI